MSDQASEQYDIVITLEVKGKFSFVCGMMVCVGVKVWLYTFLMLVLRGSKWSASYLSCCMPGERAPSMHCV